MRWAYVSVVLASVLASGCSEETPVSVAPDALEMCLRPVDAVVVTLYEVHGAAGDCRQCIYCGTCTEIESRSVCLPVEVAANDADLDAVIRGLQFDNVLLNTEYCLAVTLLDVDGAVECSRPQDEWRSAVRDRGSATGCLMTVEPVRPDGPNADLRVREIACDGEEALHGCVLRDPSLDGTRSYCCDPTLERDRQCTADGRTLVVCDAARMGVVSRTECVAGSVCDPAREQCVCDERNFPRCGSGTATVEQCVGGELREDTCTMGECVPSSPTSCL